MITIEKCRKILQDNGEDWSEEDINEIRDFLYIHTKIIFEMNKMKGTDEKL